MTTRRATTRCRCSGTARRWCTRPARMVSTAALRQSRYLAGTIAMSSASSGTIPRNRGRGRCARLLAPAGTEPTSTSQLTAATAIPGRRPTIPRNRRSRWTHSPSASSQLGPRQPRSARPPPRPRHRDRLRSAPRRFRGIAVRRRIARRPPRPSWDRQPRSVRSPLRRRHRDRFRRLRDDSAESCLTSIRTPSARPSWDRGTRHPPHWPETSSRAHSPRHLHHSYVQILSPSSVSKYINI